MILVKILGNLLALTNTASGDLSGTYPAPSVATVGGQSAANVASGSVLANAATSANSANQIVKRDALGKVVVGEIDLSQNSLSNFKANTNIQTGTTYTLLASDMAKIIYFTNNSAITLTVPSGLPSGFHCMVVQEGSGQVTWSPSGVTISNRNGHTKSAGPDSAFSLVAKSTANAYLTQGDTA